LLQGIEQETPISFKSVAPTLSSLSSNQEEVVSERSGYEGSSAAQGGLQQSKPRLCRHRLPANPETTSNKNFRVGRKHHGGEI